MNLNMQGPKKGEVRSRLQQALLDLIRSAELGLPLSAIDGFMANHAGYAGGDDLGALRSRLTKLELAGHIHQAVVDHQRRWFPGPVPADREAARQPAAVVPPRRINVMEGQYTPKPFTPARAGAMQYAQVPSLHMGHRRTFRSEAATK